MQPADCGDGKEPVTGAEEFAHAFNNILCVINNHATLVMDELQPPDPKYESLTEIKAATARAAELVDRFLALPPATLPAGPPGRETLLVLEPEQKMLAAAAAILTRQGYAVLTAATPAAAGRLAEEHAGDIHLLLAGGLTEEQGRELRAELVARRPCLRAIFIVGRAAGNCARGAVDGDGVPQLARPFTAAALLGKVRAVLDGGAG